MVAGVAGGLEVGVGVEVAESAGLVGLEEAAAVGVVVSSGRGAADGPVREAPQAAAARDRRPSAAGRTT